MIVAGRIWLQHDMLGVGPPMTIKSKRLRRVGRARSREVLDPRRAIYGQSTTEQRADLPSLLDELFFDSRRHGFHEVSPSKIHESEACTCSFTGPL
jgi:hypothetical protein